MKKLISALAVVFAIAASYSCQREADYITDPAQAVTVTYNVSLDQVQKTKATLAELDNAVAVNKLFYSVYVQSGTGTSATYTPVNHSDYHKVVALNPNGTAEVTIKLIENDSYKVVFWAQKDNAYLTAPADGQLALTGALENIAIDYSASDSFAEDKDAFTAYDILEISPVTTNSENGKSFQKEIHLKRPFAQINFGADDGAQAAALGYAPYKVKVSVKQAATTFNAATGVAAGAQDVEFKQVELPATAVNFTVNSKEYQRIGKAYVLPVGTFTVDQTTQAITDALSANVEITLDLQLQKADQTTVDLDSRAKANVPVRSNYRTNLLGSLITTDVTFNVVVDNDYDGSTDYISIVTAGNASGNEAVTLTQPETISSNINFGEHPVTLDETLTIGADVTITGGSSITVNKGIVVAAGNTLTLDDVTINPSSSEATITIEPGASLIINGGTYTADNTQVLFNLLSGSNPAPVAPGAIRPRAHGADGDQLIIRGGSFTGFDPTPYVDTDHYTVTGTGPWTVAAKQVTLTVEAGDVNMKVGDEAVLKTLTVDPADTDLSGISFEYSVANVAAASYSEGKISIAAVGAGSTVITVKVGVASATINVTVLPADSIEVAPASLSLKVGQTSEAVTVTLNNNATVSSVASNNANATVNWTSGNTFTVTGAAIGESTITVTASNGKTATVAVTVSKADAVKLAAPVLSTETADAGETSIVLSWTAVEHASGYAVSYGAESPVNVSTNEVTLSNLALATEYTITVVAKGDGDAYTDSDASNSIKVTTEKGTVSIALVKDEFELIEGTDATVSQAQIQASVKYGTTVVDGAALTYAVKDDDLKGNVTVSSTGLVTAGAGEAAATILVNYAGNATYKAAEATVTVGVSEKALESITLNTDLVKKTFELNEEFTHANIVVTANYNNNTTADVTAQATFSALDMTSAGQKTVTVSYGGKSATYNITVNEPATPVKTDQSITLTLDGNSIVGTTVNKAYGDAAFTVTAEAPSNNVVLTSGNTSVATVSGTTITIVGVGSAVITANAAETESYNAAEPVSFTVAVAKADLAAPTVTATAGDDKKITVSWATVTGAASYTVKIGETETANATSPFVTAALANGTYAVYVKAIGDANHNDSAYSTAQNVEIADAQVTYTTIAQLKQAITATRSGSSDTAKDDFDINVQNVYVSYVNGNNAYLQDASGAILLYKSGHNLTAGKTINGHITGSGCIYQGLYELVDLVSSDATIGDGSVPAPAVVTVAQLNDNLASYESQRVKLEGVTLKDAISNRAGTLVQGNEEIALYLKNSSATIPTGKTFDIIVYPGMHNEDKQVNIWAADDDITNVHNTTVVTTELSVAAIVVKVGQDKSIVPTVTPNDAIITYALKTASDSQYVTVDSDNAKVHGVKKTTSPVVVVATVAAVDGEYTYASAEFNVTVTEDSGSGDAVGTKYINEDFSTLTTWSTSAATSFDLTDGTWTASGAYSQSGCIKLGKSSASSTSITLPALSAMNDSSCDVTLSFKAVSSDSGYTLSISTTGSETIDPNSVTITKHDAAINSGASTAAELATAFAASTAAFTVTITDATPSTVITISASNAKRWYLDDVVVEKTN